MLAGIDVRPALSRKTGVGRYLLGLVPALVRAGVDIVALSASVKERLDPGAFAGAEVVDRRLPSRLLTAAWNRLGWPSFEQLTGRPVDLTHSPTPLPLPTHRGARVVTLHDLFFLSDPSAGSGEPRREWVPRLRRALATADAIVCVSAATAERARALLDAPAERIHVVHHGLEPAWLEEADPLSARAEARRLGAGDRFILAVGALEVRKNYPRLLAAFARLRPGDGLNLVLAGPDGPDRERVLATRARLGLGERVVLLGYQDDAALRALYRSAELLAMPSLDEGFGFPVLEAMASGCPVVAADRGALPEVTGDAALLVDPEDETALLAAMSRLLEDGALRDTLLATGRKRAEAFRWEDAARRTALVYARAIERRRG